MKKKFLFAFQCPDKTIYRVEGYSYEEISKSVHYTDILISITRI